MKTKKFRPDVDVQEWKGAVAPYDIVKEGAIALVAVLLLTTVLAIFFGSPDEKPVTIRQWAQASPVDFGTTALTELSGTSGSAAYGPPYNTAADGQALGPFKLAKFAGVRIPIDAAQDFVLQPLSQLSSDNSVVADLATWRAASDAQRTTWLNAANSATTSMTFSAGHLVLSTTTAGPVPNFLDALTGMARSGALDADLLAGKSFYSGDYTKPLLLLTDGTYFKNLGLSQHLGGNQWGMMNETGNYPGQAWLWLYTFWYQIAPYNSSPNGDVLVWGTMMILTLVLFLVPFIPGLRSIPRWTRVYKIIWREHYKGHR